MKHLQTEVFNDVTKIVQMLCAFEDFDAKTVKDLLDISCKVKVPSTDGVNNESNSLTVSYPLMDVITDEVSTWFTNRTFDRVNLLMSDIVKHVKSVEADCVMIVQEELDDRMKAQAEEYEDFVISPSGKRIRNGAKDPEQPPDTPNNPPGPRSPSEYGDEELRFMDSINDQGGGTSANVAPNEAALKQKLSDIQKAKAAILQKHRDQCSRLQSRDNTTLVESPANGNNTRNTLVNQNDSEGEGESEGEGGRESSRNSSHPPSRPSSPQVELESKHFYMDDKVPDNDPIGALPNSERDYQNAVSSGVAPDEVLKVNVPMGLWNCGTSTNVSIETWMESLLLKPGHRANMFLTHNILMSMHKAVHDHFASRYLIDNVNSRMFVGDQVNKKRMDAAFSFIQVRCMEKDLKERGWTTLPKCPFVKEPMDTLDSFYRNCDYEVRGNPIWEIIAQSEHDSENIEQLGERGSGRRMTSRFGCMELLEESSQMEWKQRARLDVFIGIIVQALGVATRKDGVWDLFMPKSGGRPLCTDPNTGPQQLHCDYGIDPKIVKEVLAQPGYFVMVAGKLGFTIWMAEGSHIYRHKPEWTKERLDVKQVFIEPYSVLIGRGDLFHSGDMYDDKYNKDGAIRYHLLLCPDDGDFYNEIQYLKGAKINWIGLP